LAHSLFEPAPIPLGEKLWRRVRDLNLGLPAKELREKPCPGKTNIVRSTQADELDARGRQRYLLAALTADPIKK
jgi:hypothetical protein